MALVMRSSRRLRVLRNIKVLGTGKFLPEMVVTDEEMDKNLNVPKGWTEKITGVKERHFVQTETAAQMGAYAVQVALKDANLSLKDIDLILCGSGTMHQPIPSTASLIHEQLGLQGSGIPAFDVNATCLSFITALDTISYAMMAGKYKKVVIVSSEVASVGLNWEDKESAALFGDGAAAIVLGTSNGNGSKIIASHMETYSEGAHMSEIRGGGTTLHPRKQPADTDYLFDMNGKAIFRLSSRILPGFMERFLGQTEYTLDDIGLVIPHQASAMAMRIIRKKLGIKEERFMNIVHNHGNMIAASIPTGLHEAIKQGKIHRGDKVLLLGTSAGLSIGGILLEY